MDTKLKNIKHSFATKLVAVILAAVMFFAAGYTASLFIRGFFFYNGYENREFTQTTAFRWQLNNYIQQVIWAGEAQTCETLEDYKKTDMGISIVDECAAEIKNVTNAYEFLENKGVEIHIDIENRYRYTYNFSGLTYYFRYDGNLISEDEFNSLIFSEPAAEITHPVSDSVENTSVTVNVEHLTETTTVRGAYYPYDGRSLPVEIKEIAEALYTLDSISDHTCYGEVPLDSMIAEIQASYDERLINNYNDYITYDSRLTKSVKSINYVVIYESGAVFSNCGLTSADSEEKILEKMGNEFVECVKGGKYALIKGNAVPEPSNLMGEAHNSVYGSDYNRKSVLENSNFASIHEKVKSAYFGYAPDYLPASENLDSFWVSQNSFHDFSGNSAFLKNSSNSLAIFLVSLLLGAAICIYLLRVSGKTTTGIKTYFIDKIPIEITSLVGLAIMFLLGMAAVFLVVYESEPIDHINYNGDFIDLLIYRLSSCTTDIMGVLVSAFFLIWTGLNSIAVRNIRNKTFFKRTLVYWIIHPLRWVWKKAKGVLRRFSNKVKFILACDYANGKGKKFKTIACCSVAGFVVATIIYYAWATCLFWAWGDEELGIILWIIGAIGDIAIILFALLTVVSLDRIMTGASKMRNGDLNTHIDTTRMPSFMRRFADDILSMQDGLQNAVENAVKDQRMKAELITNVSHDLKTPLTSIVNYVDLLKKCEIEDETARNYVSILDEKAQRMKKLIEDLVEASKASSGAVEIRPVKLNLCELATQAIGEHSDELNKLGIDLVLKAPQFPVTVFADAQKTSRIVENLFSNIRKYALGGTRVYVEVTSGTDFGSLVFKNISKNPLDISPHELTQRFVRGDSSRSGEGSGLGLSIAKDLCELQKGRLGIQIDGDLFKVTVDLPKI